uniref:Chromatin modification-related protein EAF7 n=2 Tax=Brassica oleracea var. oleracea TaxID=109376 RepID=A0A0D3CD29_BRAOL
MCLVVAEALVEEGGRYENLRLIESLKLWTVAPCFIAGLENWPAQFGVQTRNPNLIEEREGNTKMGGRNDEVGGDKDKEKEEEQDDMSVHSPCKALPSSASSLSKEQSQVELELTFLEALEIYPPVKLRGIHRHFVLYGLMEYLGRSFDRQFSADEVLQLLDRFYNVEMLKSDDEEIDILNHEEDFTLPPSYFDKEEQ